MKNAEIKKLTRQGFKLVGTEKRKPKPEEKMVSATQSVLHGIKQAVELNTKTANALIKEAQAQTKAVADLPDKPTGAPRKKKFELICHRNGEGFIAKITITEL